jgi:hypothetical protein
MTRVWFSALGASQQPPRPWFVDFDDGSEPMLVQRVDVHGRIETDFRDEAYRELPGGPRGILIVHGEIVIEP